MAIKKLRDGRKLLIREPVVTDAAELIEMLHKVHRETGFLLRTPEEFNITLEQEENLIREKNKDPDYLFLVGEVDERIVTSMGAQRGTRNKLKHTALFGISVLKDYWGLGIGRAMIEELFNWAKMKGIEKINLEVFEGNVRAQNLYRSLGFKVEGRRQKQIKIDGDYQDLILMTRFMDREK